jgi:hypothetical protein
MTFGERNYPFKTTWKDTSKPGKDSTGFKRGGRSWNDGEEKFMKSANPKADAEFYGPYHGRKRPDGGTDIGDLTDRFKGAKGIDSGDDGHGDDGVRS